jgi:small subunit ribosomal protein S27Ae
MAKKVVKKGKKKHINQPTSKKYKMYTISGDSIKRKKTCPRCGPGIFVMEASNRIYCGKCHYTEFNSSVKHTEKPKVAVPGKK